MISAPAILSRVSRWSWSVEPSPVAVMPSATNTTVKDRQKMIAGKRTVFRSWSPSRISMTETPLTADR